MAKGKVGHLNIPEHSYDFDDNPYEVNSNYVFYGSKKMEHIANICHSSEQVFWIKRA